MAVGPGQRRLRGSRARGHDSQLVERLADELREVLSVGHIDPATLVSIAREKAVSGYIGDGSNHWPAVHRLDSGRLFARAFEKAPAGSVLHAVADEGVRIRDIAAVIGRQLDLPVVSISAEEAGEHFTWLGGFLGLDSPASSVLTRELLGWEPTQPGLIDDLDQGYYFREPSPVSHA